MNADGIPVCALCGVYCHQPHPFTVTLDNRLLHNLTLCIQHRELMRETLERTIAAEQQGRRAA